MFICDTVNTGFDIGFVYDPLVNRFGECDDDGSVVG